MSCRRGSTTSPPSRSGSARRLPTALDNHLEELTGASIELRRDRELAFYGSEDLVPLESYSGDDAEGALEMARLTEELVSPHATG